MLAAATAVAVTTFFGWLLRIFATATAMVTMTFAATATTLMAMLVATTAAGRMDMAMGDLFGASVAY